MDPSYIQRGAGSSATRSSASNNSSGNSHSSAHHHNGGYAHQRGHRGSGSSTMQGHGFGGVNSPSTGRASSSSMITHSDSYLAKGNGSGYLHHSMGEFPPNIAGGWHSGSSVSLVGPSLHSSGSNGVSRSGHNSSGGHAKRHRGLETPAAPSQGGPHHDALMELARENLLLKHQLHVATAEVKSDLTVKLTRVLFVCIHVLHV